MKKTPAVIRHTAMGIAADALHKAFAEYDQAVIVMIAHLLKQGKKPKEIERIVAEKLLKFAIPFSH